MQPFNFFNFLLEEVMLACFCNADAWKKPIYTSCLIWNFLARRVPRVSRISNFLVEICLLQSQLGCCLQNYRREVPLTSLFLSNKSRLGRKVENARMGDKGRWRVTAIRNRWPSVECNSIFQWKQLGFDMDRFQVFGQCWETFAKSEHCLSLCSKK